ncbi:MAG TPA: hypothetical protein VJO99_12865 [Burkholderiaceae bacterium]|nr:hypothetical protein [Burkholderiaceae bacterium]
MIQIAREMRRTGAIGAVLLTSVLVVGCGGGGDDDGPPPSALDRAAGFYEGTTVGQRHISVIVLETGRYYTIYGPLGSPTSSQIEGVMVGDGDAGGSTFSSNSLQNVNFTNQTSTPGALSATFSLQRYFDANIAYVGGATDSFAADYSFDYEQQPSIASVAGNYSGQLAAIDGVETAALTISSSGAVSLATPGGCSAGGTIFLHPFGNVYDISLSYGALCPAAGQTLTGHATYHSATGAFTAIATSPTFVDVTLVLGTKN